MRGGWGGLGWDFTMGMVGGVGGRGVEGRRLGCGLWGWVGWALGGIDGRMEAGGFSGGVER